MYWIITKYIITAGLVVLISEIAKRSDKLGALVASLPLITILTLIWLYVENQTEQKIANHAYYTFFYVISTLPMFISFPYLLKHFNFWLTLAICILITIISFVAFARLLKVVGIELF